MIEQKRGAPISITCNMFFSGIINLFISASGFDAAFGWIYPL